MRSAIPAALIVALGGHAHAQAPGQVATPPAPPTVPPTPPAAPAPRDVMADRWAVDLSLWLGSANPRVDNAKEAAVGGLELSGRFRIRSDIEVALDLQAGGGNNDTVAMAGLWADFRYRFLSERPWNWIGVVGVGVMSASGKDASDDDKKGRGAFRIGTGVERRFGSFALEADLRFYMMGQQPNVVVVSPPTAANQLAHYNVTGGTLVIGASYYF
jgi:hypothetical protein